MRLFHKYIWGGTVLCLACPRTSRPLIHVGLPAQWHYLWHHRPA